MEIKRSEPRITQKQILKQMGYADSTKKWKRDDFQMNGPYCGK